MAEHVSDFDDRSGAEAPGDERRNHLRLKLTEEQVSTTLRSMADALYHLPASEEAELEMRAVSAQIMAIVKTYFETEDRPASAKTTRKPARKAVRKPVSKTSKADTEA